MQTAATLEPATSPAAAELKRGWRILLGACIGLGLGLSGLPFFTFGTFVVSLNADFGWPRGQIAGAASALVIGTAFTAPLMGTLIDRRKVRFIGAASMAGIGLCYVAMSQFSGTLTQFYLAWFAMALIGCGTTPVVWTRVVNLWFDHSRGFALGVTLAGAGFASIFGPIFCAALIQAHGWPAGYQGIAALLMLFAAPALLVLFANEVPPDRPGPEQAAALEGLTLKELLRTVQFWKIALGFFIIAATLASTLVNVVPILVDHGMALMSAARLAGLMGIAIVIGRIGVGLLVDRFPPLIVAACMLIGSALGCLLLVSATDTLTAAVSVILIGIAVGAEVDLLAYFTSRYFGMRAYGKVYGCQTTTFYIASASGQLLTGLAFDHFHSYAPGLYVTSVGVVVATCIILSLGKPPELSRS